MNIEGGALEFESLLNNDKLDKAIEESRKRIQGFSEAVVGAGDTMDETTKEIVECIEVQEKVIQQLEEDVRMLDAQLENLGPGQGQQDLIDQAERARQELQEEKEALVVLEKELQNSVSATQEFGQSFNMSAAEIEKAFGMIDQMTDMHKAALTQLEAEYQRLGEAAGKAFMSGNDDEFRSLTAKQEAIKGEIRVRQQLLREIEQQADALAEAERKTEEQRQKTEENSKAQVTFRTRIRQVREELIAMEQAGLRATDPKKYKELQQELGRLQDAMDDATQQARVLANDEAAFQGVIQGLSGLSGAFTAITGGLSFFAGEDENLQKILVKVQSLMALTIGMQQVSQTLNKDSAFQLVTVEGIRSWWAEVVEKANVYQTTVEAVTESTESISDAISETAESISDAVDALTTTADTVAETANTAAQTANTASETANTVATEANTVAEQANTAARGANTAATTGNTVATGAQTAAATAGTAANIGLAGAFRLVGVAIKSIPVFGWIIAGISALIGLYSYFSSKAAEAKKKQEEFSNALIEGCYKPIGTIENLSLKWNKLGDDMEAKKKFIDENKKSFNELGVAIRSVADAENLLNAGKDAFIEAQIAKAKAVVYLQQASEKVKEQMKLEEEISKMSDTRLYFVGGGSFGGGTYYEGENTAKTKKKKQLEELKAEIKQGYENAANEELAGFNILNEAGIKGAETYDEGSVGAIEQVIAKERAALKLISDPTKYKEALKGIEKLEKDLQAITGKKITGGGGAKKDPFQENLDKRKKQYETFSKWMNSGDEILAKTAKKEFAKLLKEGDNYLDYLKKQRETLLAIANPTKKDTENLKKVNDAIADETRKTVLETFNQDLQAQLNNARSIAEMLQIIEKKRQTLANDNTDVDNEKKESLDEAEKNVAQKAKEDTDQLLANYSSYLTKKIEMERQYTEDMILLEKRLSEATTEEEKQRVQGAIDARKKAYQMESKTSGDENYDKLVEDYQTFEQKKTAISEDFDEKRRTAREHGNEELVNRLTEAEQKALSNLALDELTNSGDWSKLFGNLDELTSKEIERLMARIQSQEVILGVKFDPKDLETIKTKLTEAQGVLNQRNPFKALINGIKEFREASEETESKKSLTNIFESAASSLDLLKGGFDSVVGGLADMGLAGDEVTQGLMNDIGKMVGSAGELASGIATGNPLAVIQGSVGMLTAAFDVFNSKDRKKEREIQKHKKAVEQLKEVYQDLERAVDKALGGDEYRNQQQMIANLKQQQQHFSQMAQAERDKKKTDKNKVKEYEQAYKEAGQKIEDILEEITQDILQTNAKDAASQLGDALVEAFGKGEDAAEAFGKTANDIMKQAVYNQLKKNFLEKQLQGALDGLEKSMGYWDGDTFVFDGLTEAEQQKFRNQIASIGASFGEALKVYEDLFKDLTEEEFDTSLTGAVKGVSEETASLVAGQMNAIRIHQIESIELIRQQLMVLNQIAQNTSFNSYLARLDDIVSLLKGNNVSDSLRSQGLS